MFQKYSVLEKSILMVNLITSRHLILPNSALSWNFSLAENLANLSLQDRATEWHYNQPSPPPPPCQMDYKKWIISGTTFWIKLKF